MKNRILIIVLMFTTLAVQSQSFADLFDQRDYNELIKYAEKSEKLNEIELYYVGFAFFRLNKDKQAIEMYDKAIKKGLDTDYIYFYKGLSLRFDKQYKKAITSFKKAIKRNPIGQQNYTELGNVYYIQNKFEKALTYYYKARELDFESATAYLKIPFIYMLQGDYQKALEEYRLSQNSIDKSVLEYSNILQKIGYLEYIYTKNYEKSIEAYSEMISLDPNNYNLYPELIRPYYSNGDFKECDSLFNVLLVQYKKGNLSAECMKSKKVAMGEFKWEGQKILMYKYLERPLETVDLVYEINLLSPDANSIESTCIIEHVNQNETNEESITERTFSYWVNSEIDYLNLKRALTMILEKELPPIPHKIKGVKER